MDQDLIQIKSTRNCFEIVLKPSDVIFLQKGKTNFKYTKNGILGITQFLRCNAQVHFIKI